MSHKDFKEAHAEKGTNDLSQDNNSTVNYPLTSSSAISSLFSCVSFWIWKMNILMSFVFDRDSCWGQLYRGKVSDLISIDHFLKHLQYLRIVKANDPFLSLEFFDTPSHVVFVFWRSACAHTNCSSSIPFTILTIIDCKT